MSFDAKEIYVETSDESKVTRWPAVVVFFFFFLCFARFVFDAMMNNSAFHDKSKKVGRSDFVCFFCFRCSFFFPEEVCFCSCNK